MTKERGFTLADVVAILSVLAVIASMGIPQFLPSRSTPREASALANLRLIMTVETLYASTHPNGEFGTLEELRGAGLLDANFDSRIRNGYSFEIVSFGKTGFSAKAVPVASGSEGRQFFGDETGVIRSLPADPASDPVSTPGNESVKTILIPVLR